ncbi:MAG: dicarboxylate/amino acid:cation symporter, partial [Planctomycetales bacterium]|nr:dicarboxylate/amino acid:cation symporter [Planctomycetales bacterium]
MKQIPLHWRILIGMTAGIAFGVLLLTVFGKQTAEGFVVDWIEPFGLMFINALKVIAVPLVIASLIKGVSDLKDLSSLGSLGGRTVALYLMTTAVAVTLGLVIAMTVSPGKLISEPTRDALAADQQEEAAGKLDIANKQKEMGPLQPLVDLVPGNLFLAVTDNSSMLQVIVFVLFFGVGLLLVAPDKAKPVKDFFDGLNEVILKLIDLIMLAAPVGVFALMAALVAKTPSWDVFHSLLVYCLCVLGGLLLLIFAFYPVLIVVFTRRKYTSFFQGIIPAQLLAFSTSSSAATLPVTMERVEEHLGVDEEVASFVLPIGATVNMDG